MRMEEFINREKESHLTYDLIDSFLLINAKKYRFCFLDVSDFEISFLILKDVVNYLIICSQTYQILY